MPIRYSQSPFAESVLFDAVDDEAGIAFTISSLGAEPISLRVRDAQGRWRGVLHRDGDAGKPESGWGNHATLMGYHIHRILNGETKYRGRDLKGGTHGFLRHKEFAPPRVLDDGLEFSIGPDRIGELEYPGRVGMRLSYRIAGGALEVGFAFRNLDAEAPAHVSFGLHPGFAVPSRDAYEVILPQGRYIRHLAPGDFLSGETEEIDFPGGPMPFGKDVLEGSHLVEFGDVEDRVVRLEGASCGRPVAIDLREAPYLTLWSNQIDDFICIEPCWGLPDHHEQRPFEEKLGMQEIPPAGGLGRSFSIRFPG